VKVLIADDDAVSRLLLRKTLEPMGHQVVQAANGLEAWEIFERGDVHLVVSDWVMPELDGPELCRRIRAAGSAKYTYFILLTCLVGKGRYLEGMEAGADDFVTKPFDRDELEATLRVAERILSLEAAVRQLEGLLPICSYCRKISDEQGQWVQLERFINDRTNASFTHGICPNCFDTRVQPELASWVERSGPTGSH
jgi:phosphoserine phosphatase RsbU/P